MVIELVVNFLILGLSVFCFFYVGATMPKSPVNELGAEQWPQALLVLLAIALIWNLINSSKNKEGGDCRRIPVVWQGYVRICKEQAVYRHGDGNGHGVALRAIGLYLHQPAVSGRLRYSSGGAQTVDDPVILRFDYVHPICWICRFPGSYASQGTSSIPAEFCALYRVADSGINRREV